MIIDQAGIKNGNIILFDALMVDEESGKYCVSPKEGRIFMIHEPPKTSVAGSMFETQDILIYLSHPLRHQNKTVVSWGISELSSGLLVYHNIVRNRYYIEFDFMAKAKRAKKMFTQPITAQAFHELTGLQYPINNITTAL